MVPIREGHDDANLAEALSCQSGAGQGICQLCQLKVRGTIEQELLYIMRLYTLH